MRDLGRFVEDFPDDEACLTYLWRRRFALDGETAACPRCGRTCRFRRYGTAEGRRAWTCTGCGHHVHPTAGTILEKSSTGLRLWFHAAHLVAGGAPAVDLRRELGVTYKTARRMQETLRRALATSPPGDDPLSVFVPAAEAVRRPVKREASAAGTRNNLPVERTRFVGRRGDVATVRRLLRGSRLVSLVGAGGCGKTRLAAHVGAQYPDGVWWVDLAPVSSDQPVLGAVIEALGLPRRHRDPVREYFRERSALLIFDNCEHLLDACAALVDELLAGCPRLRILVTSREPLGIGDETVWRVPPLTMPGVLDGTDPAKLRALLASDAVRLFVERAKQAMPDFRLDAGNARAVALVCRRLDGLPLAIELAAARVATLSPQEIVEALDDCFAVLLGGRRGGLPRHRTLRASMDWSHQLLEEGERVLFRRLAVFAGGFSLDAAREVCGAEDVLNRLTSLAAKSLVVLDGDRYRLLETVRQYAAERLADAGEIAMVRDRHLEWALALVERAAPDMETRLQSSWLAILAVEYPNLRAALDWAVGREGGQEPLRLVNGLAFFYVIRSDIVEGGTCVSRALAASDPTPSPRRARTLWTGSYVALVAKDFAAARVHALASLDMARELGEPSIAARALATLGNNELIRHPRQARAHLEESVALGEQAGDEWCLAYAMCLRSMSRVAQADLENARRDLALARALAEPIGDEYMLAWHWLTAALSARLAGSLVEAKARAALAGELAIEVGDPACRGWAALCAAEADSGLGHARAAHAAVGAMLAADRYARTPTSTMFLREALGKTALALGRIDEAERDLSLAAGLARDMSDPLQEASCLVSLAEISLLRRRTVDPMLDEVARLAEFVGNTWLSAAGILVRARSARAGGDLGQALRLGQRALALQHEHGYHHDALGALELIAGTQAERGSSVAAARLFGAVRGAHRRLGLRRRPVDVPRYRADRGLLRQAMDPAALAEALHAGAALTLEEAIAYAARGRGPKAHEARGWEGLTPTESTIVRLIADGLTNPEIARRMLISRATVKAHISHIFSKLGMSNRTEVAAEAVRRATDSSTTAAEL